MSLFTRITAAFLAMTAICVGMAASFFLWFVLQSDDQLIETGLRRLEFDTRLKATRLQLQIEEAKRHVRLAAGTPPVQGLIRARRHDGVDPLDGSTLEEWRDRLETIFAELVGHTPSYLQARYIGVGDSGRELVRVQRRPGEEGVERIPPAGLQTKAEEPYFTATLELSADEVFVSEMNLNREHGEIERPFTPSLRVATPVRDRETEEVAGLVILNFHIPTELKALDVPTRDSRRFYATNVKAQYLLHPESDRNFEFEFGVLDSAVEDFPLLGDIFDGTRREASLHDEQRRRLVCARRVDFGPEASSIILVGTESVDAVTATNRGGLVWVGALCVLSIGIALVFGVWIARLATRPLTSLTMAVRELDPQTPELEIPDGLTGEAAELASVLRRTMRQLGLQNSTLQRSNREIMQFAYIASHDLREPARTIQSFTEILSREFAAELPTEGLECVSYLSAASKRMQDLISGLLDYSRLGRDAVREDTDLDALLSSVEEDLVGAARDLDATLERHPLGHRNVFPIETRLLFQNLLGNALKFCGEDRPPRIMVDVDRSGPEPVYRVTDNGPGIPEESRDKVFLIYQRMHSRKGVEGSGIGLAHCRKIVDLHGGRIWIVESPGGGCRFCFTLPEPIEP